MSDDADRCEERNKAVAKVKEEKQERVGWKCEVAACFGHDNVTRQGSLEKAVASASGKLSILYDPSPPRTWRGGNARFGRFLIASENEIAEEIGDVRFGQFTNHLRPMQRHN